MTYVATYEKQLSDSEREAEAQWMQDRDVHDVVDPATYAEWSAPVATCAAAH